MKVCVQVSYNDGTDLVCGGFLWESDPCIATLTGKVRHQPIFATFMASLTSLLTTQGAQCGLVLKMKNCTLRYGRGKLSTSR